MLHYNRTDFSEENDVNKTSASKKCIICHYWYFLERVRFQSSVCSSCHDVLMISIDINNIPIQNIHGIDYYFIISGISKNETIYIIYNKL